MGVEVLSFQTQVSEMEEARYKDEPGFLEHLRGNAARAMAESAIRTASRYQKIVPKNGDPDFDRGVITHRWRVGIETDMSEVEAREKQMEEARQDGLRQAAAICREAAARYSGVDGYCKWVIMSSLNDAAAEIEKAAR